MDSFWITYCGIINKNTISNVCSLPKERIISSPDVNSIYDVPVNFESEKLGATFLKAFGLRSRKNELKDWQELSQKIKGLKKEVKIAIVGKYFNFKSCRDTYISVIEAINHAAWFNNRAPKILWLDSEEFEKDPKKLNQLADVDGIVVPGGWGSRGVEGIILAIKFAREHKKPFLGLCLGMQLACVEFARDVLNKKEAHTVEVNPKTPDPIIGINKRQAENVKHNRYGGTLRLGAYPCELKSGTKTQIAYGTKEISERHRHRYEVNPDYIERLEKGGLVFSGKSPDEKLMEIAELPKKKHPFFLGTQFHPELKSRPLSPHPLFEAFIKAAIAK